MKKENFIPYFLLFIVAGLTYGLLIPSLGFYADDWYVLWGTATNGVQTIVDLHQIDRPLMGYFFSFYYSILGPNALAWHIFALTLRLAGGLVFLWILRMLFPKKTLETTSAALLMVVYPGLLRQTTAMTFSNQFSSFFFALLSIAFSLKAVLSFHTGKKWLFSGLGLLFSFVYVFYIEYMIGLEGLRWLVIWLAIFQQDKKFVSSIKNSVIRYFPYAIPVVVMILWRLLFFQAGRRGMDADVVLTSYSDLQSFLRIGVELFRDFFETTFIAWFYDPYVMSNGALYRDLIPSFFVAGMVVLIYIMIVRKFPNNALEYERMSLALIGIGLLSMLGGFLPVLAVGREVVLDTWQNGYNKYTLHVTASVGMFLIGLFMQLKSRKALIFCVSILLGFSVFTHYHNAVRFKAQWEVHKTIWWQFVWRVPDVVDHTLLMSVLPVFPGYIESHEIWGPANIIYRPDVYDVRVPAEILNFETKDKVFLGANDEKSVRGLFPMFRDYGKVLVFGMPTLNSCVHFYDQNKLELSRNENPLIQLVAPYSSIDRIQTHQPVAQIPAGIFGPEPAHTWCYYYQQATLARQQGDWKTVAALGDQAESNGYKPLDLVEWLPFFEGYVHGGNLEKAKHLSTIIKSDKLIWREYCRQLETSLELPGFDQALVYQSLCEK